MYPNTLWEIITVSNIRNQLKRRMIAMVQTFKSVIDKEVTFVFNSRHFQSEWNIRLQRWWFIYTPIKRPTASLFVWRVRSHAHTRKSITRALMARVNSEIHTMQNIKSRLAIKFFTGAQPITRASYTWFKNRRSKDRFIFFGRHLECRPRLVRGARRLVRIQDGVKSFWNVLLTVHETDFRFINSLPSSLSFLFTQSCPNRLCDHSRLYMFPETHVAKWHYVTQVSMSKCSSLLAFENDQLCCWQVSCCSIRSLYVQRFLWSLLSPSM